jgi:hypothetical protein
VRGSTHSHESERLVMQTRKEIMERDKKGKGEERRMEAHP